MAPISLGLQARVRVLEEFERQNGVQLVLQERVSLEEFLSQWDVDSFCPHIQGTETPAIVGITEDSDQYLFT